LSLYGCSPSTISNLAPSASNAAYAKATLSPSTFRCATHSPMPSCRARHSLSLSAHELSTRNTTSSSSSRHPPSIIGDSVGRVVVGASVVGAAVVGAAVVGASVVGAAEVSAVGSLLGCSVGDESHSICAVLAHCASHPSVQQKGSLAHTYTSHIGSSAHPGIFSPKSGAVSSRQLQHVSSPLACDVCG